MTIDELNGLMQVYQDSLLSLGMIPPVPPAPEAKEGESEPWVGDYDPDYQIRYALKQSVKSLLEVLEVALKHWGMGKAGGNRFMLVAYEGKQ